MNSIVGLFQSTITEKFVSKDEELNKRRSNYVAELLKRYPNCIPVICHKVNARNSVNLKLNIKSKQLVPADYQFMKFVAAIRTTADLKPGESLFFFVDNRVLIPSTTTMGDLYKRFASQDGMLHIQYTTENTFG